MIQQDTIRLLRECDAGIRMGISSIDEVTDVISDGALRSLLTRSKAEHEKLAGELRAQLSVYQDEGKSPNPVAQGMSWIKTNLKLAMNDSDRVVADLITDGCDMGVKSLSKYLNEYKAADEKSKDLAKRLILLEESLAKEVRRYL
ncbi:MAG: hypothetical protein IJD21_02820 [Oscillospiraceae bacterium]|nr:hypothetical protein [Oscillospiraceae bacterium]